MTNQGVGPEQTKKHSLGMWLSVCKLTSGPYATTNNDQMSL